MHRRKHSNELKAKVVLEALRGVDTANEIAKHYGVHPLMVTKWKKHAADQGAQFTCSEYVESLIQAHIRISMDGRGRALDNVFVERLWRTVKYEDLRRYEEIYRNAAYLL